MVKTIFRFIPADSTQPEREDTIDWPEDPGFAAIDALVRPLLGGAEIEHVTIWLTSDYAPGDGEYTDMFVDEIGQIKGLPANERATRIYHANILTHRPDLAGQWNLSPIHGDAVVFLRRVWF